MWFFLCTNISNPWSVDRKREAQLIVAHGVRMEEQRERHARQMRRQLEMLMDQRQQQQEQQRLLQQPDESQNGCQQQLSNEQWQLQQRRNRNRGGSGGGGGGGGGGAGEREGAVAASAAEKGGTTVGRPAPPQSSPASSGNAAGGGGGGGNNGGSRNSRRRNKNRQQQQNQRGPPPTNGPSAWERNAPVAPRICHSVPYNPSIAVTECPRAHRCSTTQCNIFNWKLWTQLLGPWTLNVFGYTLYFILHATVNRKRTTAPEKQFGLKFWVVWALWIVFHPGWR